MSSVVQLLREERVDLYASASALRCLESCPRQHWYRYVEGRPAQDTPARLILGSAMHKALAVFYGALKARAAEPGLDQLVGVAGAAISKAVASDPPILFDDGGDAEALVNEATRLLGAFLEQGYRPAQVVGVEVPFALELTHPETGEALGFEERIVGAMDLVVADEHDNVTVVDHKVASRADSQKAERPDLQMALYSWAAKQMFGVDKVGLRYQDILRTKTAKVVLQDVQRVAHDEAEGIEAAVAGLVLIHSAVGRRDGKWLMARRRSWKCKDCGWRRQCAGDRT